VANLFLGQEEIEKGPQRWVRVIDEIAMEDRALDLLKSLSVTTLRSVRTEVGSLSGGQRQSVAIARVVASSGEWIVTSSPSKK
jgi:D-xylose transport system ATP-binding protein